MTPSTYTTNAICLKTTNYSDTSKIGTWLSNDRGLIRAIAKGVRGKHRQLAGACLPLVINECQFRQGKNLHAVCQSTVVESFEHIQQDLLASSLVYCLLAVVAAFAGQQDGGESAALYQPLASALHSIEQELSARGQSQSPETHQAVLLSLLLKAIDECCMESGHAPDWHRFVDTDQPLEWLGAQPVKFSCALGGVVSPVYVFQHEPPIQLTQNTWLALSQPTEATISVHLEHGKLLAFYQHFVAHVVEQRKPLVGFEFALQLLAE